MVQEVSSCSIRNVFKIAGGFVAWLIGSGFATGQEILQFFSSYGYMSYAVIAIELGGFLMVGPILLMTGYKQKSQPFFDQFSFYCGKKLGCFYTWIILVCLVLLMAVLNSAAGSALHEYYGIDKYIGSACMSACVLLAYWIGFDKLVNIISKIGPLIILFVFTVSFLTVVKDGGSMAVAGPYAEMLKPMQAAPNFVLSAVLYLSLNFLTGSTYYAALGRSAHSLKEAKWGAVLGGIMFIFTIMLVNTGILLNAQHTASLAIPTLYLAQHISAILGAAFSIVLVLGTFCSSAAMIWSICSRVFVYDVKANRLFAIGITVGTFLLGLCSFSQLVSVFYPLVGYIGLLYIGRVLWTYHTTKP